MVPLLTRLIAGLAMLAALSGVAAQGAPPALGAGAQDDLAAELDDRMRLRQLFEGLRGRLSARELQAATLCYLHGLTRAEGRFSLGK